MTCFIIDDEPLAIEVLEAHIEHLDNVHIIGTFENAITAFQELQKKSVDLIFLDIQMPELTGIDFLKSLKNPPKIIITTAYREYAIEGFELDVVDYLLKPISLNRLLKAVAKAQIVESQASSNTGEKDSANNSYLFVYADKKMVKVALDEIKYIESQKDYVSIITEDKHLQVRKKIGDLEKDLETKSFIRIHRAFLVPLYKIDSWSASEVEIAGKFLPIGRIYKNNVDKRLQDFMNLI